MYSTCGCTYTYIGPPPLLTSTRPCVCAKLSLSIAIVILCPPIPRLSLPLPLPPGAALKGPFSRYDYQRNPNSGQSSVKSYLTLLPAAARDVYYRDEIGNISTSHLRIKEDSVEFEVRPRWAGWWVGAQSTLAVLAIIITVCWETLQLQSPLVNKIVAK